MTKLTGKKFEQLLKQSCEEQNVLFVRFRDAGFVGDKSAQRRFTIKNIADCFIFDDKRLFILELKKRNSSLTFKDITQLKALEKHSQMLSDYGYNNAGVGLLVCFNDLDSVYWIDVKGIAYLEKMTGKKSFNAKDVQQMIAEAGLAKKVNSFIPKGKRTKRMKVETCNWR